MTAKVDLPTRRFRVVDEGNALEEIRAFLESFPEGERKWCEVWYSAPAHRDPDEWDREQAEAFDAVELVDGEIVAVPPYVELEASP